jgi:N-acetyl-gamma-glutamyl-phosphate reductase
MTQKPKVFIDGEVGTTGLQIYARLSDRDDLELIRIDPELRKDTQARSHCINSADLAILCLPDAASKEAAAMVEAGSTVKLLDASSAHRTAPGWVYGFPELNEGQRDRIRSAPLVSNPGCYPTGFIAAVQPLIKAGLIPANYACTLNAISGYSGGGRQMIEQYEAFHQAQAGETSTYPYGIYGLKFGHKHIKEMHHYSGLAHAPLFVPSVGDFEQGMLVQVPLPLWSFGQVPTGEQIHAALERYYKAEKFVQVMPYQGEGSLRNGNFLDAQEANGTNFVQIFVFANDTTQEALLVSRLDNLGKGASGAAIQNLNIMLGFPETLGLI